RCRLAPACASGCCGTRTLEGSFPRTVGERSVPIEFFRSAFGLSWMTSKRAKKKERRNQGRSPSPDQGAAKNSTWPTLPFGSAVQALLLCFKGLAAQVGRFRGSSSCRSRVFWVCPRSHNAATVMPPVDLLLGPAESPRDTVSNAVRV